MWFLMVILNFLVAIVRFMVASLNIKRPFAVLSDCIGFLDPKNMGIDWIVLLGASVANLIYDDFMWFLVVILIFLVAILSF